MVVSKVNISYQSMVDGVRHKPTSSCVDDAVVVGTGGNIISKAFRIAP